MRFESSAIRNNRKLSMKVDHKEIVEGLDKYLAPSFENDEVVAAESYTRYLNKLHDSAVMAHSYEKHAGFGRGYPGSPMIDKEFVLSDEEMEVLQKLKDAKPFRAEGADYIDMLQEAFIGLAKVHHHVAPAVRHDGHWFGGGLRSSFYTPHTIFLTGPKSLITALHEYTHSLGFGEVAATWWSTNTFRLLYPKSFEKLRVSKLSPHLMRRHVEEDVEADANFGRRRNLHEFKGFMDEYQDFVDSLNDKNDNDADDDEAKDVVILEGE